MSGRNKFRVAPADERTIGDTTYDSKAERIRAEELQLLMRGDVIRQIVEQPRFELGVPENVYYADFKVTDCDGNVWVEDVKGYETPKFRRDKKLWRSYGPHPLKILKRVRRGWQTKTIMGGAMQEMRE